jgi:hypothetical protein
MSQATCRIFVNHRPHYIDGLDLVGADLARLAGVPLDNVVIEVEAAGGLREMALYERLAVADGQSFLVTRQFIMGGAA